MPGPETEIINRPENENKSEHFKMLIDKAKREALTDNELEADKDLHDKLVSDFFYERINRKEFEAYDPKQEGLIKIDSLGDFRLVLSIIGFGKSDIDDMVDHEMSHYSAAKKLGLDAFFCIQFMIDEKNDRFKLYPSTVKIFPDNMPDDEIRSCMRQMNKAPIDYLSPRDTRQRQ